MKVLKKGPDTEWGKELRCRGDGVGETAGCGALLLVSPADVKSETLAYFDELSTSYWFVCPECGAETAVKPSVFTTR